MLIRLHLIVLTAACALAAQNVTAPIGTRTIEGGDHSAVWIGQAGPAGAVSLRGADVRFEGPPIKDAPYSAEAVTEVVQTLADGNRIRHENRTKIYRDSQGRTRREEKMQAIGPWAATQSDAEMIFINDPVAEVHWIVDPQQKTARKMPVPKIERLHGLTGNTSFKMFSQTESANAVEGGQRRTMTIEHRSSSSSSSSGTAEAAENIEHNQVFIRRAPAPHVTPAVLADAVGVEAEIEELGERTIEGVVATGVRRTRTIEAGQIGNDRPIEVVFEEWRSEELGVTMKSVRSDPRSGVTTFELKNVQRSNPQPTLFEPPAGYEIIEMPAFANLHTVEIEKN